MPRILIFIMGAQQSSSRVAKTPSTSHRYHPSDSSVHPRYEKKTVTVLGKRMAYSEVVEDEPHGDECDTDTIVFVHGNPTSSYMWRNVMPRCEGLGRLLAVDLIGMGDSDKLTESDCEEKADGNEVDRYSLKEQSRYFAAFLDAVGVRSDVTFVAHSWGGTLAAIWGHENPDAVKALVSLEVVYAPFSSWERVPPKIRGGVRLMLRAPVLKNCFGGRFAFDVGAHLILSKNLMLESMPARVKRKLNENEMAYYRRPFPDCESRLPILAFVRSIPVAGEPRDVVEIMDAGREWIESSTEAGNLKVLFVNAEPGTMTEDDRNCIRSWRNVTEVVVNGGHMVTEDCPDEVGMAIAKWFREVVVQEH
jgi:haloalkane dehalogenase